MHKNNSIIILYTFKDVNECNLMEITSVTRIVLIQMGPMYAHVILASHELKKGPVKASDILDGVVILIYGTSF